MPYINNKNGRRDELNQGCNPTNAGELNYKITSICSHYLALLGEKYQTYNDIIGSLESAKLEFYRRKVGYFEDTKKNLNGDVF